LNDLKTHLLLKFAAAADGFTSEQHTGSYYGADQSSQSSIDYQVLLLS
jgi:hypothetical protein